MFETHDNRVSLSPVGWLGAVIVIIAVTIIVVVLDIPVLRPVISFCFLTFIPGYLLLSILRRNDTGTTEKIVLSVGLSISFIMIFSLLLNGLMTAVGYSSPLSKQSLLVSYGTVTVILAAIAYLRRRRYPPTAGGPGLTTKEKGLLAVALLFPIISLAGTRMMNAAGNNTLMMILLIAIPLYIIFLAFYRRNVTDNAYPAIIYCISISLVMILALRSSHVIGSDIHEEYYVFMSTMSNEKWSILGSGILDSCLSISILPTVYEAFMDINPEMLFKTLYPILFSFSPLVVYTIARKYTGGFYAFLMAFLFMSQFLFLWSTSSSRTVLAILCFELSIMVLFHTGIHLVNKRILFIIFAVACIFSHYGTSFLYFFLLVLTWLIVKIIDSFTGRIKKEKEGSPATRTNMPGINISLTTVVLYLVIVYLWHGAIIGISFELGIGIVKNVFQNIAQWFMVEARGATVTASLGGGISIVPQWIRVIMSWLEVGLIAIGILYALIFFRKTLDIPSSNNKSEFLQNRLDMEFFAMSLAGSALMVIFVFLPNLMVSYSLERVFLQLFIIFSPLFVIGAMLTAKYIRTRARVVALIVLIPFFLCTTGVIYQAFGSTVSMVLNSEGAEYQLWYVQEQDSYAAKWITGRTGEEATIYSNGQRGARILSSQGNIPSLQVKRAVESYEDGLDTDGYIYVRYTENIHEGIVTLYPGIYGDKNKIYAAGGSEIYR